ncbi:MAG: glycosyltransferase family 39 protein [Candidatus Pacebacteria bacterium]|nr:glycosyltransferase family 39 protein [Candidatus Paceibacterota bacterium]
MSNRKTYIVAGILIFAAFILAILSIRNDTFTYDETAHVAAGYSYLTQRDYRMNPEHPPLIKDIAAIPLLFLHLNFPKNNPEWQTASPAEWWDQFNFASQFLYYSGNNPDQILFWSRIPMILVFLLLGFFIFFWAKELFGNTAALISLFLFSFSPIFLANGRLVTTDVGAAFGTVFATYFWLKFLKNPSKKSIIFAGLAFGIAMLLKFSLILLLPFFALITLVFAGLKQDTEKKYKTLFKYVGFSFLALLIGVVFIIWPVYEFHVSNYPQTRQIQDTQALLATTLVPKSVINLNLLMDKNQITRPLGQYFLGLLTATNRTSTGNTTYFMGQISADSWKSYFPIVYFIKNPLAFHILTFIAIIFLIWFLIRKNLKEQIKSHFTVFSMFVFLAIYWATSLVSNLNIGVRHLLPIFPFTILLVSGGISYLLKEPYLKLNPVRNLKFLNGVKYAILGILVLWQAVSLILVFPHFIAYFNEAIGGPNLGYMYVVDSNLDWGQDLKRLAKYIDENKIDKIYLDYFGGGNANYYLKEKYAPWWGQRSPDELPKGSYLAVSATLLQGGRATPAKGFDQPSDYYRWLDKYTPVAKIGYSIFVYKIE